MKKIFIAIILVIFISLSSFAEEYNWKQFSKFVYLNTDKIEYFKGDDGLQHAAICEKHLRNKKDDANNNVGKICMKHYNKHLGYMLTINDINIDKKTCTLCYIILYDTQGKELGSVELGKEEDCKPIPPLTVEDDIFQYVVNTKSSKDNRRMK